MSEPGGYGRRSWVRYLLIYLVIGAAVYALVWFLFFRDGGYF